MTHPRFPPPPRRRLRTTRPALISRPRPGALPPVAPPSLDIEPGQLAVLRNRRFLALWLAQLATQVGGNMVLYGLTIQVYRLTQSNAAVSLLILTFLVPAVIFSAVAGVYVDRLDRRLILIATNLARAAAFLLMVVLGGQLIFLYALNIFVSTATTFFAPAEASTIPLLVERRQLLAANGIFTFTLQAAFALGFAVLGPLVVNLGGSDSLLLLVSALYLVAAGLCWILPPQPSPKRALGADALGQAEAAVATMARQLGEGLAYIRSNQRIFWSLSYLAITASLIGVLGVLGPAFAQKALGLREQDFVVVVLPLGFGLVMGILLLNVYGRFAQRRRVIEGGLLGMALALALLSAAGPISRFLQARTQTGPLVELGPLVSLLSIVVFIALALGVAYAFVAVPSQTQLQEELPEDVRGRVFGVLNMLVSIASFLPIVVVGPVADLVGPPIVILASGLVVGAAGVASILAAHPTTGGPAAPGVALAPVDPVAVTSVPLTRPSHLATAPDVPDPLTHGATVPAPGGLGRGNGESDREGGA